MQHTDIFCNAFLQIARRKKAALKTFSFKRDGTIGIGPCQARNFLGWRKKGNHCPKLFSQKHNKVLLDDCGKFEGWKVLKVLLTMKSGTVKLFAQSSATELGSEVFFSVMSSSSSSFNLLSDRSSLLPSAFSIRNLPKIKNWNRTRKTIQQQVHSENIFQIWIRKKLVGFIWGHGMYFSNEIFIYLDIEMVQ